MASENTLIAYDVENNFDLFYRDIQDGITALSCGSIYTGNKK